jgi:hypothetical protein
MRKIDLKWRLRLVMGYLFLYLLVTMFIGSRPPLPFLPYGLGILIVMAVGICAALLAHRFKVRRKLLLSVFTICCLIYSGFSLVHAFLYLRIGGNIYWIRSLAGLPLLLIVWLVATGRYNFLPTKTEYEADL